MSKDELLVIDRLTKRFGGLVAVNDVSIEVKKGEILGLIGPNGSGKTTLFNIITGLYSPDGGTITFKGERIEGLTRRFRKKPARSEGRNPWSTRRSLASEEASWLTQNYTLLMKRQNPRL